MLPIFTPKSQEEEVPAEEAMPQDTDDAPPEDDMSEMPMDDMGESIHKIDKSIAVYMPPEYGPFTCSNCLHFLDGGQCAIVSGPVEPEGVCRVFEPAHEPTDQAPDEGEADLETAVPVEEPVETETVEEGE